MIHARPATFLDVQIVRGICKDHSSALHASKVYFGAKESALLHVMTGPTFPSTKTGVCHVTEPASDAIVNLALA